MILVKDLVKFLKKDIIITIDLGSDDYNVTHLVIYNEKEHGNLTIDDIFFTDEKSIGIKVL